MNTRRKFLSMLGLAPVAIATGAAAAVATPPNATRQLYGLGLVGEYRGPKITRVEVEMDFDGAAFKREIEAIVNEGIRAQNLKLKELSSTVASDIT